MESIDLTFIVAICAIVIVTISVCICGIFASRYEFYEKALNYAVATNSTLEIK